MAGSLAWKKTSVRTGSIKWNCSSAAAAIRSKLGQKLFEVEFEF